LEVSGIFMGASSDGTTVAVAVPNNSSGPLLVWHAATDQWSGYQQGGQFWEGVAIAGDGNRIAAAVNTSAGSLFPNAIIYDAQLNSVARTDYSDNDFVEQDRRLVFEQTGALLYARVSGVGFDIMDAFR